jgi:hypothetical protein
MITSIVFCATRAILTRTEFIVYVIYYLMWGYPQLRRDDHLLYAVSPILAAIWQVILNSTIVYFRINNIACL